MMTVSKSPYHAVLSAVSCTGSARPRPPEVLRSSLVSAERPRDSRTVSPGEQSIPRYAQREHLRALIGGLLSEQFRRHVASSATQTIVVRLIDARQIGKPQVEQFDLAIGKQENVFRFKVAVNDL